MSVILINAWVDVLDSMTSCLRGAIRAPLEIVTDASKFESDSFCSFNVSSDETDALGDLSFATGVECHAISLCLSEKIARI